MSQLKWVDFTVFNNILMKNIFKNIRYKKTEKKKKRKLNKRNRASMHLHLLPL